MLLHAHSESGVFLIKATNPSARAVSLPSSFKFSWQIYLWRHKIAHKAKLALASSTIFICMHFCFSVWLLAPWNGCSLSILWMDHGMTQNMFWRSSLQEIKVDYICYKLKVTILYCVKYIRNQYSCLHLLIS